MEDSNYNAIVIGSGIGGLTAAALLTRFNHQRVLVLEQSFSPGGQTQSFSGKGNFQWDPGLHYVGEMAEKQLGKMVFDYITDSKLLWNRISSPLEKIYFPDFTFDIPDNPQLFMETLLNQFPQELEAIKQYFYDLKALRNWMLRFELNGSFPYPLAFFNKMWNLSLNKVARLTTADYMNTRFQDEKLKAILTSQWGNYGLPPEKSLFALHAFFAFHFLEGAWYPKGGSRNLFKSIIPVIKRSGGMIKLNTRVTRILINNRNQAIGVVTLQRIDGKDHEIEYYAPIIISGIGIPETQKYLLPVNWPITLQNTWEDIPPGVSCVSVYAGLKDNPKTRDYTAANYRIFKHHDFNALYKNKNDLLTGKPNHCWLTFPSLKDPEVTAHTACLVYFIDGNAFSTWKHTQWRKRGNDYEKLKTNFATSLFQLVDNHFPGFHSLIDSYEVSTPLTMQYFLQRQQGSVYGIPAVPQRYAKGVYRPKTNIKSLYLTGCDVFSAGIVGSMWGGVNCVAAINGSLGMLKLLVSMGFNLPRLLGDVYCNRLNFL